MNVLPCELYIELWALGDDIKYLSFILPALQPINCLAVFGLPLLAKSLGQSCPADCPFAYRLHWSPRFTDGIKVMMGRRIYIHVGGVHKGGGGLGVTVASSLLIFWAILQKAMCCSNTSALWCYLAQYKQKIMQYYIVHSWRRICLIYARLKISLKMLYDEKVDCIFIGILLKYIHQNIFSMLL